MEGIGQVVARRAAQPDGGIASPGRLSRRLKPVAARHAGLQNPAAVPAPANDLDQAVAAMDALRSTAASDARSLGFTDAADFAGKIEEISRTVEFLQIVAAEAVERTRSEAQASRQSSAGPGWRTGWTESMAVAADTATATGTTTVPGMDVPDLPAPAPAPGLREAAAAVDDGY
ncbi:HNH endonuclease, partial [Arthrobacter sp. B2a2-09]|nr:HNH endonuclease [Arthrobacter sp. B2a2-09]